MKLFCKNPIVAILVIFVLLFGIGLVGPMTAQAATLPPLGAAASYSILAQTGITGTATISGDVENNGTGAAITALTTAMVPTGTIYSSDAVATLGAPPAPTTLLNASVQANALAAFTTNIPLQPTSGTIIGALDGQTFTPGVYDWPGPGPLVLGAGTVTLNGAGIYIFRSATNFTSAGTVNLIGGARACDVFWRVQTNAAIGAPFIGTILSGTTIAFTAAGVNLDGRALGVGPAAAVTLGAGGTISGPTCAAAPSGGGIPTGTINVVKTVVGGTKTVADFPLFINGTPAISGQSYTLPGQSNKYTVTETADPNYTAAFSGDCDLSGVMYLHPGEVQFCILTNTFKTVPAVVPPLIDVVKVPSPLALPAGPGAVTYTYTVRNIGTVPMTNVTLVGDTCSPINLISGDSNSDSKLDVAETWTYTCTTNLTATHTNTVVATGWANGISATDIASATVVVGTPVIPPLIHVTKLPSPLTLLAKGGMVTYTEKITNPGTVALSNVKLTDDKCSPMTYISGDTNSDSKLDTTETWTYTCRTNLTKTTTNTAVATGEANGFTVRDIAIATVTVATVVPALPNTGFAPLESSIPWNILIVSGLILLISTSLLLVLRKLS